MKLNYTPHPTPTRGLVFKSIFYCVGDDLWYSVRNSVRVPVERSVRNSVNNSVYYSVWNEMNEDENEAHI